MKKEVKANKMTIDKLAVMVAKGFGNVEQRFEKVEQRFENVEKKMATKEDLKIQQEATQVMLKEINAIHADTKSFRDNISTLYTDHIAYDRKIDNLTVRVEKLEIKK